MPQSRKGSFVRWLATRFEQAAQQARLDVLPVKAEFTRAGQLSNSRLPVEEGRVIEATFQVALNDALNALEVARVGFPPQPDATTELVREATQDFFLLTAPSIGAGSATLDPSYIEVKRACLDEANTRAQATITQHQLDRRNRESWIKQNSSLVQLSVTIVAVAGLALTIANACSKMLER